MSTFNVHDALQAALEAAQAAGEILASRQQQLLSEGRDSLHVITKSGPHDYASDADREAQETIVKRMQKDFPTHRFLGEEGDTDHLGDPKSPYRWIIDPLDGTTNFLHGKPNYGTLIALQENRETIVGVMTRPCFDEVYTAVRGEGAYLNGTRLKLRRTQGMSDAVLCCNIIHRARKLESGMLIVPVPFCASVENYGNAIEEFAVTLKGWNDGVFFEGPKLWDVAAGCLLIEECGGRSRTELKDPGDARSGVLCAATTKEIFEDVEEFVFGTLKTERAT